MVHLGPEKAALGKKGLNALLDFFIFGIILKLTEGFKLGQVTFQKYLILCGKNSKLILVYFRTNFVFILHDLIWL